MQAYAMPDIPGDNLTHKLGDSVPANFPHKCSMIHFFATGGASPHIALGGSTTDASHGAHIPLNTPFLWPSKGADPTVFFDLDEIYAYIPTGDTLTWSIIC